jgi:very-short-patch-repair endonuclease
MENLFGVLVSVLAVSLVLYVLFKKIRWWFWPKISPEAKALHRALIDMGIPAQLELFDGYKTIDIAVPEAKIHIEVDGAHHNTSSRQALTDLKRTYFSLQQGIYTIRIPNSLIRQHLPETADYVSRIIQANWSRTKRSR